MNISKRKKFQKLIDTPGVKRLVEAFETNGFEIRFVGGVVRDLLMNKQSKDIDFATTATPIQMIKMCEREQLRVIETGIEHGTVTIIVDDNHFEVTTLRIDTDHDGRHCQVEFTDDWIADAGRRDLTINSISADIRGNVFDPFDGIFDLKEQPIVIRFVGDPYQRIEEDYLRVLRAFRFICKTDGRLDIETRVALKSLGPRMFDSISGERIQAELMQLLSYYDCYGIVDQCYYDRILPFHSGDLHKLDHPALTNIERFAIICRSIEKCYREELLEKLKMSRADRKFIQYYATNPQLDSLDQAKMILAIEVHVEGNSETIRPFLASIFDIQKQPELADAIRRWEIPQPPFSGHQLLEQGLSGKQLGEVLKKQKLQWLMQEIFSEG